MCVCSSSNFERDERKRERRVKEKIYGFLNGYKTIYESLLFDTTNNRCQPHKIPSLPLIYIVILRKFEGRYHDDYVRFRFEKKIFAISSIGFPATFCLKEEKEKLLNILKSKTFLSTLLKCLISSRRIFTTNWISLLKTTFYHIQFENVKVQHHIVDEIIASWSEFYWRH